MLFKDTEQKDVEIFWQEYAEQIGQKVLARGLGRYISGWKEFDIGGLTSLWGLIIATDGGFRFHHFPQQHWADLIGRRREKPTERIFTIPGEKIISSELKKETNWLKKIFGSPAPILSIIYRDESGEERKLLLEADIIHGDLAGSLKP